MIDNKEDIMKCLNEMFGFGEKKSTTLQRMSTEPLERFFRVSDDKIRQLLNGADLGLVITIMTDKPKGKVVINLLYVPANNETVVQVAINTEKDRVEKTIRVKGALTDSKVLVGELKKNNVVFLESLRFRSIEPDVVTATKIVEARQIYTAKAKSRVVEAVRVDGINDPFEISGSSDSALSLTGVTEVAVKPYRGPKDGLLVAEEHLEDATAYYKRKLINKLDPFNNRVIADAELLPANDLDIENGHSNPLLITYEDSREQIYYGGDVLYFLVKIKVHPYNDRIEESRVVEARSIRRGRIVELDNTGKNGVNNANVTNIGNTTNPNIVRNNSTVNAKSANNTAKPAAPITPTKPKAKIVKNTVDTTDEDNTKVDKSKSDDIELMKNQKARKLVQNITDTISGSINEDNKTGLSEDEYEGYMSTLQSLTRRVDYNTSPLGLYKTILAVERLIKSGAEEVLETGIPELRSKLNILDRVSRTLNIGHFVEYLDGFISKANNSFEYTQAELEVMVDGIKDTIINYCYDSKITEQRIDDDDVNLVTEMIATLLKR